VIGIKALGQAGKLVGARSMHDFRAAALRTPHCRAAAAASTDNNNPRTDNITI